VAGDRLTGSDKRALLLWVALGIIGALFAYKNFFRAFPEASVDFRVSRGEALARAKNFVSGLGENVSGYQSTIVFDVDENAKVYLERELGLQQANRMMASELSVWYWDVRFFRPQQEEEFHVRVSPAGDIAGYDHKVEEARAGAALDRAAAQTIAQTFLSSKLGEDLSAWDFLSEEANSNQRPKRLDWSLTWEKHGFRAKEAPYRLRVTLDGDRVGGIEKFLKVPEVWERGYRRLRSGNEALAQVFIIPYLLLIGSAVWLGIALTRRGQTSWSGAIKLGIVVAIFLFLMQLNQWPIERAHYDTNASYGSFAFDQIAKAILFALGSALTVALILPAAEPLYRASQPVRLRLGNALTLGGLRSKEFFSSAVVGLSMAAAHIGFLVFFYTVATHFGAWAPQELNYEDSVSTAFPWISGVAIGLLASTSEEFLFRLFAIPFLEKLTRSRWIAVIVPAFLWSFLHSNYPQEPAYIRGIEVGVIGIVAGVVMLRWGILATLIWHYTVDASLVGMLLVRSNSLYFKVSGIVVASAALAPLAFAGISYLTRGRFETSEDLLNSAAPAPDVSLTRAPASAEITATPRRYDALAPGMISFLAACLIVGGLLAWRLKPESIGDYLKLSVNARTVRTRADEIIRQRGLDPNSFYHATLLVDRSDPLANEFLRQRIGTAALNDIYAKQVPGALWLVRYFRDSQAEEFAVVLKPDGSLHSVHHTLAEDAPGASLSKEEALVRAEQFLRDEKKLDLSQWTLVEANSDKRPHRIDHTLTWQKIDALGAAAGASAGTAENAHARIDLQVLGEEVANYRTYIKIPDDWRRKQEEVTLVRTIFAYSVPILLAAGLFLTALVLYVRRMHSEEARAIPWRRLTLWAFWGLAGFLLVFTLGNDIARALSTYETARPFKLEIGGLVISLLLGAPFYFGTLVFVFGLAWFYASRAFGEVRIPSWTGMPAAYYRDALWIGLGGAAGLLGLHRLIDTAEQHWPTVHRSIEFSLGQNFDATLPAAAILGSTLLRGLFATGLVCLIVSFFSAEIRPRWLRLLLFVLGAVAMVGGNWDSPADFAKHFLANTILLGVLLIGVQRVMRFNIFGCFLVAAITSLLGRALELLSQPDTFYRANGYAVLLLLFLLLAWPFSAWRMQTNARSA
jgi:membrane protease YdiL (CAAX protease family)